MNHTMYEAEIEHSHDIKVAQFPRVGIWETSSPAGEQEGEIICLESLPNQRHASQQNNE